MSVMTPDDFPNYQNPDTNRWSYHLANDPYGGAAGAWAKKFYDDPNSDPNQAIQGQIGAFRQRYGAAAPADDRGVLEMIATGQAPQQQAQTPTQQWNSSGSVTTQTGPFSDTSKQLLELLMGRAQQGLAVGRDNPNVRAQVDPMVAQMERSSRNYLDDVAERSMGRPFNMQGEQRLAAERLGQQAGAFESEVIGREIGAKRQEIAEALQLWGSMMSDEQRMTLQMQLAQLDDKYRYASLGQNQDQFLREMGLRWWDAENRDYYTRSGLGG